MGSKGGRGKLRARGKGEDVRDNLRSIEKNEGEGGGRRYGKRMDMREKEAGIREGEKRGRREELRNE